jgi:hypothetical protein
MLALTATTISSAVLLDPTSSLPLLDFTNDDYTSLAMSSESAERELVTKTTSSKVSTETNTSPARKTTQDSDIATSNIMQLLSPESQWHPHFSSTSTKANNDRSNGTVVTTTTTIITSSTSKLVSVPAPVSNDQSSAVPSDQPSIVPTTPRTSGISDSPILYHDSRPPTDHYMATRNAPIFTSEISPSPTISPSSELTPRVHVPHTKKYSTTQTLPTDSVSHTIELTDSSRNGAPIIYDSATPSDVSTTLSHSPTSPASTMKGLIKSLDLTLDDQNTTVVVLANVPQQSGATTTVSHRVRGKIQYPTLSPTLMTDNTQLSPASLAAHSFRTRTTDIFARGSNGSLLSTTRWSQNGSKPTTMKRKSKKYHSKKKHGKGTKSMKMKSMSKSSKDGGKGGKGNSGMSMASSHSSKSGKIKIKCVTEAPTISAVTGPTIFPSVSSSPTFVPTVSSFPTATTTPTTSGTLSQFPSTSVDLPTLMPTQEGQIGIDSAAPTAFLSATVTPTSTTSFPTIVQTTQAPATSLIPTTSSQTLDPTAAPSRSMQTAAPTTSIPTTGTSGPTTSQITLAPTTTDAQATATPTVNAQTTIPTSSTSNAPTSGTTTPTAAPTSGTAVPTVPPTSGTTTPTGTPTPPLFQIFQTMVELQAAIDQFVLGGLNEVAMETIYGPIESWNVGALTDFSALFDTSRNDALVNFNEDISNCKAPSMYSENSNSFMSILTIHFFLFLNIQFNNLLTAHHTRGYVECRHA